jgi:hypothetical protein
MNTTWKLIDVATGIERAPSWKHRPKGDINGIPLAERAINEYWDACPR